MSRYDGQIAGLYDLEGTLGRGHFAVVKLARHAFTGEKVAVKVIEKSKLDPVSRAHLFQEVRCMKLVQHPNVVRLYEVIDTATRLYLVLELGDGGDLYDMIMKHETGLGEEQARRYFRQIVNAISYCHGLHVVHRDLKPENVVFFEKLGMVKLTDFGFSNRFCPGQKLETSCGSLAYSAPEILLGDSYDAPAVDVWSLGVILYMLVCGRAPFQEANDSETLTMIMDCKYDIPTHVSEQCRRLIARMLIREPESRATLQEIATDPWLLDVAEPAAHLSDYLPLVSREHLAEEDHTHIIQKMVNGNIATKEKIVEALDRNEYNHITATYFLLAERKLRAHRQEQAQRMRRGQPALLSQSENNGGSGPVEQVTLTVTENDDSPSPNLISPAAVELLVVPRSSGDAGQIIRGRKCSIVQEEEEDDEVGTGETEGLAPPGMELIRRGSRSEGRLNAAVQERLKERRTNAARPSSAAPSPPPPPPLPLPTVPRLGNWSSLPVPSTAPKSSSLPVPSTAPKLSLPSPARPLHAVLSSPQLVLPELSEDSALSAIHHSVTAPAGAALRRLDRRQRGTTTRAASCSSSDASDEDSEGRQKRHKMKSLPRRDSHDDSSDSQDPCGGSGGGGGGGGGVIGGNHQTDHKSERGTDKGNSGGCSGGGKGSGGGRRRAAHPLRANSGETRLRESQSLNRITEVQETGDSPVPNNVATPNLAPNTVTTTAVSSRKEEKENRVASRRVRLSRYLESRAKMCLPLLRGRLYRARSCSALKEPPPHPDINQNVGQLTQTTCRHVPGTKGCRLC